jgi:hypothetical protein
LIHPIAGKCKHCKADLTGYHAARPAATTPLPSLHPGNGHAGGPAMPRAPTNGVHGAPVPVPVPPPVHAVSLPYEPQAVLPPRPTGRSPTVEPASAWRSWPVVVIILAIVAIGVAVVLMIWPDGAHRLVDPGKHALRPPPAPERMPTQPDIKQALPDRRTQPAPRPTDPRPTDPWAPQGRPAPDPVPPADPGAQDDVPAQQDPQPHADIPGHRTMRFTGGSAMFFAMVTHMCRKMAQCGTDDVMTKSLCDGIPPSPSTLPASCPAAARCLQHIDEMSCNTQFTDLTQVGAFMVQFNDCSDAARC